MALAPSLQQYLDQMHVRYDAIYHTVAVSASRAAQASGISGDKIAKGVLLRDPEGYTLAVLPASCHIRLADAGAILGCPVRLATEQEIGQIFTDCAPGAVPPVGGAYGLDVIVDGQLTEGGEVFLEGGDHITLLRVTISEFEKLMTGARRARFAEHD